MNLADRPRVRVHAEKVPASDRVSEYESPGSGAATDSGRYPVSGHIGAVDAGRSTRAGDHSTRLAIGGDHRCSVLCPVLDRRPALARFRLPAGSVDARRPNFLSQPRRLVVFRPRQARARISKGPVRAGGLQTPASDSRHSKPPSLPLPPGTRRPTSNGDHSALGTF